MSTRSSRVGFGGALVALSLCALAGTGDALAHPELDEGQRLASELEFEAALRAFDRALEQGALTRAELIELLSERVLLHHALRDGDALHEDFVWLSALAPEFRLDLRAPADLVAQWDAVRERGHGALRVVLSARVDALHFEAHADLHGSVPRDTRVRMLWRTGEKDWSAREALQLREKLGAGQQVALYAEALGPGRTVVATSHSQMEPLRLRAPQLAVPLPAWETEAREPRAARRKWWIAGACALGAAALVASVLLVRAAATRHTTRTEVTPGVEF